MGWRDNIKKHRKRTTSCGVILCNINCPHWDMRSSLLFDYLLGGAGAVGVGGHLEVHALEWLGALNACEVVVAITPPSAF